MYQNNAYNQPQRQNTGYNNGMNTNQNKYNPQQQQNKYHHYAQSYAQNPNNYAQSSYQLPRNNNINNHQQPNINNHHKSVPLQQANNAAYFAQQSYSTNNLMQHQALKNNQSGPQSYQPKNMHSVPMQQQSMAMNSLNRNNSGGGDPPPPPPPSSPPNKNNNQKINKRKHGKKQKKKSSNPYYNAPNKALPQPNGSMNVNGAMNASPNASMNGSTLSPNNKNNGAYNGYNAPIINNGYNNNGYNNNGYTNPVAAFHAQAMQQGSQYGSSFGMQPQQQMGSNRNLVTNNVYNKQLVNNPSGDYGLQQPSQNFMHQYGPNGFVQHQMFTNTNYNAFPYDNDNDTYYAQQPQEGGGDLVPPPPMEKDENGEMVPKEKKKSKKKKKRKKNRGKDGKKRSRKSKRDKDGKRRHKHRHKDGKKKRSSSRSRDSRDKRKSKSSTSPKNKKSGNDSDSPPPPPPPSNKLLPPVGGQTNDSIESEDASSSSDDSSADSEDIKENVPDPGYEDAGKVFKDQVEAAGKKKRKGKHGRFESKNQFIRRRPVSGVPMSVQKQLHGVTDDKVSSHLKLIHSKRTEKTKQTIKFLKECLLKEVLFQGMDDGMINEIVDVMYRVDCPFGECIIRQNEYGDAYFVIQSGAFDIIHQEMDGAQQKIVGEMLPGKAFGEGSLLYSIPRAATLKATKPCVVWSLDATKFLEIRQKISQQVNDKTSKVVRYLKKIELFKKYHHQDLVAIGQAVTERKYAKNAHVIQQGDEASEFFIVKTGAAIAVIKTDDGKEQTVKKYSDGDFFGERGIYKNEKRAASIIATSTTRCYVIKAIDFKKLLANPLSKQFEEQIKQYDDIAFDNGIKRPFQNLIACKLADFQVLGILGVGSFGRVSLVKDPMSSITYSLKKVRKNKVIETGQQEHVRNERAVLATLDSSFCVKLFGTYSDELNIFFLMEPVLGGELFTVLRWNKRFSEKTARFYAACVVLAFEHLHGKNIIYRDLKPENLLIHKNGYCKLVDFGFAKKRNNSCTLCGTPEYLSPEVIQNYNQGFAVDWWALGIFVYEMVVGHAPFQDDPNVKMYEKILTYDVEFAADPKLTPRVEHLICGLLEKNSYARLGAGTHATQQILNHPWFHGLDWNEMREQKIGPPYVPNIAGQDDLSHYDAYPDENIVEKLDPDPSAYEWCEDF